MTPLLRLLAAALLLCASAAPAAVPRQRAAHPAERAHAQRRTGAIPGVAPLEPRSAAARPARRRCAATGQRAELAEALRAQDGGHARLQALGRPARAPARQ